MLLNYVEDNNMRKKIDRSNVKVKKEGGFRQGRGFSLEELKKANKSLIQARILGLPIDQKRKSCHEENVKVIKKAK